MKFIESDTDGGSFETMRSLEQALTFGQTEEEFRKRGIAFGVKQRQTLRLTADEGVYTNLGLLLSDQCVHTIKAAVFEGTDQCNFKDRREFSGSLLKQLNDVYDYIDFRNSTRAVFDKLLRIDIRDYPETAVREALFNLLVHRDYSYRASGIIGLYKDRIEFISLGGLLPGVSLEDVMLGLSVCRNVGLANVFYRLQLIEAYGTGIRKIMGAYKNCPAQPVFEVSGNAFKLTLPNVSYARTQEADKPFELHVKREKYTAGAEDIIMAYVREHGEISRARAERLLDASLAAAYRVLRRLAEKGLLVQVKRGKNTVYLPV